MPDKIVLDGQEYNSVEEMPPDIRKAYEALAQIFPDKDQNGVPDLLDGALPISTNVKVVTHTRFKHNGQTYNSLEEMPPDVRAVIEKALQKKGLENNPQPSSLQTPATPAYPTVADNRPPSAIGSLDEPSDSRRTWLILITIVAGLVILGGLLLVFGKLF